MFRLFKHSLTLRRHLHTGGHWHTIGNFVYHSDSHSYWSSQRQAAKMLGVSANVLSKHLSGKLPKLYMR
jgi:hypothetical protein